MTVMGVLEGKAALHDGGCVVLQGPQVDRAGPQGVWLQGLMVQECWRHGGQWGRPLTLISYREDSKMLHLSL